MFGRRVYIYTRIVSLAAFLKLVVFKVVILLVRTKQVSVGRNFGSLDVEAVLEYSAARLCECSVPFFY